MLIRYGVTIPANTNPQLKNVAAVTVHADLPPFAKTGQTIDVTVSSIGNAQSLRGGSLIMTPLHRRRRRGVCHRPGQPGGRRLRRLGQGRLEHRGQRALGGPSAEWRDRRTRSAERIHHRALRHAQPAHAGLHHLGAAHRGHQQAAGRGHRAVDGRRVRQGGRAGRCQPAHRVSRDARSHRDRAGRCARARHRQFTHRHRGHRLARARDAGGGVARLADR